MKKNIKSKIYIFSLFHLNYLKNCNARILCLLRSILYTERTHKNATSTTTVSSFYSVLFLQNMHIAKFSWLYLHLQYYLKTFKMVIPRSRTKTFKFSWFLGRRWSRILCGELCILQTSYLDTRLFLHSNLMHDPGREYPVCPAASTWFFNPVVNSSFSTTVRKSLNIIRC